MKMQRTNLEAAQFRRVNARISDRVVFLVAVKLVEHRSLSGEGFPDFIVLAEVHIWHL
jgi:hypothetical protein